MSLRSQMSPPADFRAKYDLEWKNDKLYATEHDLVMHIMDQYDKPVPLRGDVDAMKLTNMFSLMFGTGLADSINSVVVDRSNLADGIQQLKSSIGASGDKRVAVYVQSYNGPRGNRPMPEGLDMPKEHEDRLRALQYSLPGREDEPYAVYMVVLAMNGHPIFFRLSDFAHENEDGTYRMVFPSRLQAILETCTLLIWTKEEFEEILENTYHGTPGWNYTPKGSSIER
ncbi:MAG: hypothetical protein GY820_21845, partial [Gammaproteobacteria bacterium]|nr:hypothetical protein [Gammaproteobacteria bacterium]